MTNTFFLNKKIKNWGGGVGRTKINFPVHLAVSNPNKPAAMGQACSTFRVCKYRIFILQFKPVYQK